MCSPHFYIVLHILRLSPRFYYVLLVQFIHNLYNLLHTFTICSTLYNYVHTFISLDGYNYKYGGGQYKSVTKWRVWATVHVVSAPICLNFRHFYPIC